MVCQITRRDDTRIRHSFPARCVQPTGVEPNQRKTRVAADVQMECYG